MAVKIDFNLTAKDLHPAVNRMFEISAAKILQLDRTWDSDKGAPVFTAEGRYTTRGWTEWTEGFRYGSSLLQFDATGEAKFFKSARSQVVERMAPHLTHTGVHDHGFNNISTYGNLLRLMVEKRSPAGLQDLEVCQMALKVSGAVQAARWTEIAGGMGFIHSFNGPHSLFIDTMRSLRSLGAAFVLGHYLHSEQDQKISLLNRLVEHGLVTARFGVYYGEGRDAYDRRGRVAHESIFNTRNGAYRCPNSQQGYSPFTTWTRGLAWALCGFAEQLEFLETLPGSAFNRSHSKSSALKEFEKAAFAAADYYLEQTPICGVPYWDTGAPGLVQIRDYLHRPADPYNRFEPVDSSAAAIAAQGFLRLGNYLGVKTAQGRRYRQAGLTIARTLLAPPYISLQKEHQGLLLHSVYHRPNGWDYVPPGENIPHGESSMWGDYHLRELGLMIQREALLKPCPTFFGALQPGKGVR